MPKKKIKKDANGSFVWQTYFVGGRQKREKVYLIDGQRVGNLDAYLLANANDIYLHQIERWDLIEQRRLDEEKEQNQIIGCEPSPHPAFIKSTPPPPMRRVNLNILDIEGALEFLGDSEDCFDDEDFSHSSFLNLDNGQLIHSEDEDEQMDCLNDENLLELPQDLFEELRFFVMEDFIASLDGHPLLGRLRQFGGGKGSFRRFKNVVFSDVELTHLWNWFNTRRKRECIVRWLKSCMIDPVWGCDIFEAPPLPNKRGDLLRAVLAFVQKAGQLPEVRRIALLGSLTTDKAIPKDVDLLVEVEDGAPLDDIARLKRKLQGQTMQTGDSCGADIFLCDPQGQYLGRICFWKTCAPGIRRACQARHCGQRKYLNDDFQNIRLEQHLLDEPPIDLWPKVILRIDPPKDVQTELLTPLQTAKNTHQTTSPLTSDCPEADAGSSGLPNGASVGSRS